MSEIDIRNPGVSIEFIRFSDDIVNQTHVGSVLTRSEQHNNRVEIRDIGFDDYRTGFGYVTLSKDSATNLIKGLEKAIELGWFES